MHIAWSTLALQTVNFVILVWLLNRLLYKPVLRMVDARKAEVDRQFAEARAADQKAKAGLDAVEAERKGLAAERETALRTAAAEAEQLSKARLTQAKKEADTVLSDGQKKLALERTQASAEIRGAALELGLNVARRLLSRTPGPATVAPVTAYFANLAASDLDDLRRQLAGAAKLRVVTASALDDHAAESWRQALRRSLGEHVAIEFATDPGLIAGADLHFPNADLRFSWAEALNQIENEMPTDAAAG